MQAHTLLGLLENEGINWFSGVPDSQLKALCDALMDRYGIADGHHLIAHNEGGCTALAAGHYLATGRVPCVYMQNSGIGNMVNPAASLTNPLVYGIPVLYIVGWRGQPGLKDEPQHIFQGQVTNTLLRDIDITTRIITQETSPQQLDEWLLQFNSLFAEGKSAALIVEKDALTADVDYQYSNNNTLVRERAIEIIAKTAGESVIVSSTGKISRELFEVRERRGEEHKKDFLTVGSMGHASMVALGIALEKKTATVWCVDGDGAVLMHMGALAMVGSCKPRNFVHIVLNNAAHETVGGMPTVANTLDIPAAALAAGYTNVSQVVDEISLENALAEAAQNAGPTLVEVMVSMGARGNLGRPSTTPQQNKYALMEYIKAL